MTFLGENLPRFEEFPKILALRKDIIYKRYLRASPPPENWLTLIYDETSKMAGGIYIRNNLQKWVGKSLSRRKFFLMLCLKSYFQERAVQYSRKQLKNIAKNSIKALGIYGVLFMGSYGVKLTYFPYDVAKSSTTNF